MEKIVTPTFRVSFAHVFKSHAFSENQDPKYSVVMLFDKSEDLSKLKELAQKTITNKWPDATKRPKNLRNPFRDGDVDKPDLQGYQGTIFVTASSKQRPGVVDKNMEPILNEDEFYSGCYARASLTCYAYSQMGNSGIGFGLQNIQKIKDGDPFTGRAKPEDDFEVIDDGPFTKSSISTDDMFA